MLASKAKRASYATSRMTIFHTAGCLTIQCSVSSFPQDYISFAAIRLGNRALSRCRGDHVRCSDEEDKAALPRTPLSGGRYQLRRALVFTVPAEPARYRGAVVGDRAKAGAMPRYRERARCSRASDTIARSMIATAHSGRPSSPGEGLAHEPVATPSAAASQNAC